MARKKTKFKAYICSKDCDYHIPDDKNGINIFFSKKSLKETQKCVKTKCCKIVEIEIKLPKEYQD